MNHFSRNKIFWLASYYINLFNKLNYQLRFNLSMRLLLLYMWFVLICTCSYFTQRIKKWCNGFICFNSSIMLWIWHENCVEKMAKSIFFQKSLGGHATILKLSFHPLFLELSFHFSRFFQIQEHLIGFRFLALIVGRREKFL